jgi:hypothetical protein
LHARRSTSEAEAVIQTDRGGLELSNIELVAPDTAGARDVPSLLRVNGELRLFRCILRTNPGGRGPNNFQSLVDVVGSGDTSADRVTVCAVRQSVLLLHADKAACVRVQGIGSRVLLQQSLLATSGDGIAFAPGKDLASRANVQCSLENCTVAARKAAVALHDVAATDVPAEPILVQTRTCAFINPFPGTGFTAGLLRGHGTRLTRGVLVWQADGDGLDRRLHYGVGVEGALPQDHQPLNIEWVRFLGTEGSRNLDCDLDLSKLSFTASDWPLQKLDVTVFKKPLMKEPRVFGVKPGDLPLAKLK